MAKRLAFLLFNGLLLANHKSSIIPKELSFSEQLDREDERKNLLTFVMHEMATMFTISIEQGKILIHNVLKDAEIMPAKTKTFEMHLNKFKKFIQKVNKFELKPSEARMHEIFELSDEFDSLIENYDNKFGLRHETSMEEIFIAHELHKYGLEHLDSDFMLMFMDFSEKLTQKVEHYLKSLNEEAYAEETNMVKWFKSFKDERDLQKKLQICVQFIDFF